MRILKTRIHTQLLASRQRLPLTLALLGVTLVVVGLMALTPSVTAQEGTAPQRSPLHPTFALLDADGNNVLESGQPVSTMMTCGTCHDAAFIASHSFHSDAGLSSIAPAGEVPFAGEWDSSPGFFGRWDPLNYRYLSPTEDTRIDLTTADWLATLGSRHVGGGPAVFSRDGVPLVELPPDASNPEAAIVNPETGELEPWNWAESGVVEMNCFLCHMPTPNNEARMDMLHTGKFGWANSATLLGTGLIEQTAEGDWLWNTDAFDADGLLLEENVTVHDPSIENCGQCHGLVHVDAQTPLVIDDCTPSQWSTITTGQIFSPQRLSESGINVEDKHDISRAWDVHAERVLSCTDCHYSLNNPIYYRENDESQPDHLTFDPRRIDLGEYLYRPLHEFAKGQSSQNLLAPEFDNTLRRCESCHDATSSHSWLPYQERHTTTMACETCHIPTMYAPARQYNDWTVLTLDSAPHSVCRGVAEMGATFSTALLEGYQPVLLPRLNADGTTQLAPHNLVTSWFWVYGEPARPVALRDLETAWLEGDGYHPEIMAVFDVDLNDQIDNNELILDTEEKERLVTRRLADLGLDNPRIMGEVRPYTINHTVTHGEWATRDCQTCHTDDSRLNAPMVLADRVPSDELPVFVSSPATTMSGEITLTDDGQLRYEPRHDTEVTNLYVFGADSVGWIDGLGALLFLGTVLGITAHSGLRYVSARRRPTPKDPSLRREYMYSVYERQWHWLQTAAILGLLFTGLIIHKPAVFSIFSFPFVVQVHNILAAILVINAALALFYHLVSGEIRQFLPRPYGFFDQAVEQALYYLRGIFQGKEHPFHKSPDRKMNPLQQITYLAILNVLLPLQILTGIVMWGVQTWPDIANTLGGLPFLAPFHTIIAWTFATFIVAHVYLTTTIGRYPTDGIKAMIVGWEDVETDADTTE